MGLWSRDSRRVGSFASPASLCQRARAHVDVSTQAITALAGHSQWRAASIPQAAYFLTGCIRRIRPLKMISGRCPACRDWDGFRVCLAQHLKRDRILDVYPTLTSFNRAVSSCSRRGEPQLPGSP